jgi:uncharacterized protein
VLLVPFSRIHDTRYAIYWRLVAPESYTQVLAQMKAQEEAQLALESRSLDSVAPGEQQPEVEHAYAGEDSATGTALGRHWRDAGKWFGYELKPGNFQGKLELQVTYSAWENKRQFDIEVNGQVIATVALNGKERDRFVDVAYPIPTESLQPAGQTPLKVRFIAKAGSRAGPVFGIRLLKAD